MCVEAQSPLKMIKMCVIDGEYLIYTFIYN